MDYWANSMQPASILLPTQTTLCLHPVIHVPNYMDHYSFTDPWGMDGWVDNIGWPIADGLTTKWSSIQLAVWRRIGKVCQAETSILTTMLCAVSLSGLFISFAVQYLAISIHLARWGLGLQTHALHYTTLHHITIVLCHTLNTKM